MFPGLLVFAFQQKAEELKQGCRVPVLAGGPSRGAGVFLQRGAWVQDPGHGVLVCWRGAQRAVQQGKGRWERPDKRDGKSAFAVLVLKLQAQEEVAFP